MTEMLALGLGVRLAEPGGQTVFSDCAAALGSFRQIQGKKFHMSPYWQLDMFLDLDRKVVTEKVKAHPENRIIPLYSLQDRGITAADDCAGSRLKADRVVSLQEVLEIMAGFCSIVLVNGDGSIAVDNLAARRVAKDKRDYLLQRDLYRDKRGLPGRWADVNTHLGAYTLACGKKGTTDRKSVV